MKNKRGLTANERIVQELNSIKKIENAADRILVSAKTLGAIDFALEFGLITYKEWDKFVSEIFDITA